jgi:hypothetical protein
MSLLARLEGNDQAAFDELAQALLSQDNTARKQAEEFYKELLKHKPDIAVRYLVSGLSHSNADMKHFCCVYLRKVRSEGHARSRVALRALTVVLTNSVKTVGRSDAQPAEC